MDKKAVWCVKMIRIQNIYYMLAYAFQVLNEDSYKKVAAEEFEYVSDLFSAILAKGMFLICSPEVSPQRKNALKRVMLYFTYYCWWGWPPQDPVVEY